MRAQIAEFGRAGSEGSTPDPSPNCRPVVAPGRAPQEDGLDQHRSGDQYHRSPTERVEDGKSECDGHAYKLRRAPWRGEDGIHPPGPYDQRDEQPAECSDRDAVDGSSPRVSSEVRRLQIVVTDDAGYCQSPCGQHNVIGYGRGSVGLALRLIRLTAHIACSLWG